MTEGQKKTAGVAIASLVLGILGFVLLGPLGALPAVICGHIARKKINQDPELEGAGMALAGLIMGYIVIILSILAFLLCVAIMIPAVAVAKNVAQTNMCINNMRQIDGAKDIWSLETGAQSGSAVDMDAVNQFIKDGSAACSSEGTYEYGALGVDPSCSVHGSLADASMPGSYQSTPDY